MYFHDCSLKEGLQCGLCWAFCLRGARLDSKCRDRWDLPNMLPAPSVVSFLVFCCRDNIDVMMTTFRDIGDCWVASSYIDATYSTAILNDILWVWGVWYYESKHGGLPTRIVTPRPQVSSVQLCALSVGSLVSKHTHTHTWKIGAIGGKTSEVAY